MKKGYHNTQYLTHARTGVIAGRACWTTARAFRPAGAGCCYNCLTEMTNRDRIWLGRISTSYWTGPQDGTHILGKVVYFINAQTM